MMIDALDSKQFMFYARQKARLNTAYWLSVLVTEKSSIYECTEVENAEIGSFKRHIKLMLKHIRKDISRQTGTADILFRHEFNFVEKFSRHSIKTSNKRPIYGLLGMPMPGDDELLASEIAFLEQRSEQNNDNSLDARWDKGVYLLYDMMNTLERSKWLLLKNKKLKKTLDYASDLLSPELQEIKDLCAIYVARLDIDPSVAQALQDQLVEDYVEQFSKGYALYEIMETSIRIRPRLLTHKLQKKTNLDKINNLLIELKRLQEELILACIAQSNTIRRAIDAHVID
jgi:hypothetical protein